MRVKMRRVSSTFWLTESMNNRVPGILAGEDIVVPEHLKRTIPAGLPVSRKQSPRTRIPLPNPVVCIASAASRAAHLASAASRAARLASAAARAARTGFCIASAASAHGHLARGRHSSNSARPVFPSSIARALRVYPGQARGVARAGRATRACSAQPTTFSARASSALSSQVPAPARACRALASPLRGFPVCSGSPRSMSGHIPFGNKKMISQHSSVVSLKFGRMGIFGF
jgi:hypothetical protein